MSRWLIYSTLLAGCSLLATGCTERREALGGGAEHNTHVTVLRVDSGSAESGDTGASAGEKITTFGTFKGKVVVNGTAPNPGILFGADAAPDALCRGSEIPNESIVVGPEGGLANVFIFLRRTPKNVDIPAAPETPVVLDQVGCKFIPHASVVRVGQVITLKNSDKATHNVKGNGLSFTINETLGPSSERPAAARKAEGKPAEIVCNFHSWMRGWVLPLDHPWGVVTGPDGSFEITGVPAGEMEFSIYHEGTQISPNIKVTISPDAPVEQTIQVDAAKLTVK